MSQEQNGNNKSELVGSLEPTIIGAEQTPARRVTITDYTKIELFAGDASRQRAEEYAKRNNGQVFEVEEFNEMYPERHLEIWPRIFGVMVEYVVVVEQ